ncbi:alpha-tubulin suppressor-like RCC1 family protein [Acidovorax delafieldii]|uniref:IPTL-CTERM sorting domain-containing protein n=1 Tax=Acidovorax delafieldii TaxID=47920 RepID=UPI002854EFC0|nr:IPTL-CTERM sorting domain-containing protein [Acidovorax delafieldii]MDR6155561.1 alpha-tubulin suppressor-like RCC1 family protein [Acidovorax delafieldii]
MTIAAGFYYTCAVTTAAGVRCWGDDSEGQATVPAALQNGVAAITTGEGHACALTTVGAIQCWGLDNRQQSTVPSTLAHGVRSMSGHDQHTCAVSTGGGLRCWGLNTYGQTDVPALLLNAGAAAVAAGYSHTCALTTAGGVQCWGFSLNRQTEVPTALQNSGATAIAVGSGHTCALTTSGGVECWGGGANGEIDVPPGLQSSGAMAIALGSGSTCALTTAGGVQCWGYNVLHQTDVPVGLRTSGAKAITAGSNHVCALTTGGGVQCWGFNALNQASVPADLQTGGVVAISAGNAFTCALTAAGGVRCWGENYSGQASVPTSLQIGGVAAISAGKFHTCALTTAGAMQCWGANTNGQLGIDSDAQSTQAVSLAGQALFFAPGDAGTPLRALPLGSQTTLAATSNVGGASPVTFDTWTPGTCSLSGNVLTATAAGLCGVRASRTSGADGAGGSTATAPQQLRLLASAQAQPTVALATGGNPSMPGGSVTFTATLSSAFNPTGSITFSYGVTTICTEMVTAGAATCTTNSLASGTHTITAAYAGDANNAAAASSALVQKVLFQPTLTLTSGTSTSVVGASIAFTASLSGVASAAGSITFSDGAIPLCTSVVVGGAATCATSALGVGMHAITAAYAGDANNATAVAAPLPHVVQPDSLPLPRGGNAQVSFTGSAVGCHIGNIQFTATPSNGVAAPVGGTLPLGVFSFIATGAGCNNATLNVKIDYPAGSLNGLQPRKYGPQGGGAGTASWFTHGTITGDSVSYSVTDNGVGDNDPTLGAIADPFAPVLLAAPGGVASIPTLSQWGLLLMSLLAAAVGIAAVGRKAAP